MSAKVVHPTHVGIIIGQGTVCLMVDFGTEEQPLSIDEFNAVVATAMQESLAAGITPVVMTEVDIDGYQQ